MPLNNISTPAIVGVIVFALISAAVSDSQVANDLTAEIDDRYETLQRRI